jgi:hypothetical protein
MSNCADTFESLTCILTDGHAGPHKHRTGTVFVWWQKERR